MRRILWLLLLVVQGFAVNFTGNFVVFNANSTFLDAIFIPKREEFMISGVVFPNTHIYKAPIHSIITTSQIVELCSSAKDILASNNFTNCRDYFCGDIPPLPYRMSRNMTLSGDIQKSAMEIHVVAHRFCLQCSISNQNFTNTSCPWVDKTYFGDKCDARGVYPSTIPIWFNATLSVCYDRITNVFVAKNDYTHWSLLPFYLFWNSLLIFILNILFLVYTVILIVIPYTVHAIYRYRDSFLSPTSEKIAIFFNFYHFYILIMILSFIQAIFFNFLDVLSLAVYFPGRFRNISVPISVVALLFIFILLIFQWLSIYAQSQTMSRFVNKSILFVMLVMIVIGGAWGLFGASLYVAYSITEQVFLLIILGVWTILTAITFLIVSILLLIAAIRILKVFLALDITQMSPSAITVKLIGIKFTKVILGTLFLLAGNVLFLTFYGFQIAIGLDLLSYEFNFVEYGIISVWIMFVNGMVIFFLTDYAKVKRLVCGYKK
jgi:hypothetical protein